MKYRFAWILSLILAVPAFINGAASDTNSFPGLPDASAKPEKPAAPLAQQSQNYDAKSAYKQAVGQSGAAALKPAIQASQAGQTPSPAQTNSLVWDSMNKEYKAAPGATNVILTFTATNTGPAQVVIRSVKPSCGCTIATVPSNPWILQPGQSGSFTINTDLRGKRGALRKYIVIDSSEGYQLIHMTVSLPEQQNAAGNNPNTMRGRNLMAALADRQAVFKGACVQCHVTPLAGKTGADLYDAACGICHDVPNRASMVPNLYALKLPKSREYWRKWTADGKEGTLMPGFAKNLGGPLDEQQIDNLVDYLVADFGKAPAPPALPSAQPDAAAPPSPAK